MSLYRLDFRCPDGTVFSVRDRIIGGDYLTRDRARAIQYGRDTMKLAAACTEALNSARGILEAGTVIVITRIYAGGRMRETAIIDADGNVSRPVKRNR